MRVAPTLRSAEGRATGILPVPEHGRGRPRPMRVAPTLRSAGGRATGILPVPEHGRGRPRPMRVAPTLRSALRCPDPAVGDGTGGELPVAKAAAARPHSKALRAFPWAAEPVRTLTRLTCTNTLYSCDESIIQAWRGMPFPSPAHHLHVPMSTLAGACFSPWFSPSRSPRPRRAHSTTRWI